MKLITITYRKRMYHKTPTCGGMDSEPAGSYMLTCQENIVANSDTKLDEVKAWFNQKMSVYEDYEFESIHSNVKVHRIFHPTTTRL